METLTQEVMRHRVGRIGSHRTAHRRPVEPVTRRIEPAHTCPEPEVRIVRESPLPHASWITGGFLLALVSGVMLGVGIAQHWG